MMQHKLFAIDWGLLIPVIVLIVISLTTLFSVNPDFFKSQLIYVIVSLIVFFFISQIQYRAFSHLAVPIYILSVILLLIVPLLGIESRGAVRWIELFGVRVQLSEVLKPFLALALAAYLSRQESVSLKTFLTTSVLLLPVVFLIFIQPDLGNALIYVGIAVVTMILFGFPYKWFFIGLLPMILMSPIAWTFLHDYQRQRVMTFLYPTQDPLGTSYNVIQAMIAVGSGMFFGKGLGQGTQSGLRFLPERHTDFIFATLSEGLGFVGGVLVIASFVFLLWRIYRIFSECDDTFGKIVAGCLFAVILIHFFVNIGMNVGLLPIVGVTLPFVSYGGSSLLSNFIILGILSSISTSVKKMKILEIR